MGTYEERLYELFKSWKEENRTKFFYYNVLENEHPYYERLFYTIIGNSSRELTADKNCSPHNLLPQEMFLIYDNEGNLITCRFPDFIDYYKKVIIEIDGNYHNNIESKIRDAETEKLYNKYGYKVYRLKNEDVAIKAFKLLKKRYINHDFTRITKVL